jgi:hypothetical protein
MSAKVVEVWERNRKSNFPSKINSDFSEEKEENWWGSAALITSSWDVLPAHG